MIPSFAHSETEGFLDLAILLLGQAPADGHPATQIPSSVQYCKGSLWITSVLWQFCRYLVEAEARLKEALPTCMLYSGDATFNHFAILCIGLARNQ
jgi:hypothetical protein